MWIMTHNGKEVINSAAVRRFIVIDRKPGEVVVSAIFDRETPPIMLKAYTNIAEAQKALSMLYGALANEWTSYEMPDDPYYTNEERGQREKNKVTRHGGS